MNIALATVSILLSNIVYTIAFNPRHEYIETHPKVKIFAKHFKLQSTACGQWPNVLIVRGVVILHRWKGHV